VNEVSYCCPVCREESIRHKNKKFTLYCNKAQDILKRIVSLLENEIKLEKEHNLGTAWATFQSQIMDHDTDDDVDIIQSNPTTNELFRMIDNDMLPLHLQDLFSPRRLLSRSNSL
jgi:flagellin-specific chaperone FliS